MYLLKVHILKKPLPSRRQKQQVAMCCCFYRMSNPCCSRNPLGRLPWDRCPKKGCWGSIFLQRCSAFHFLPRAGTLSYRKAFLCKDQRKEIPWFRQGAGVTISGERKVISYSIWYTYFVGLNLMLGFHTSVRCSALRSRRTSKHVLNYFISKHWQIQMLLGIELNL